MCSVENCELENFDNDKCILHCKKELIKDEKRIIKEFWGALRKFIESKDEDKKIEFNNIIFPSHEQDSEYEPINDENGQWMNASELEVLATNFNTFDYNENEINKLFLLKDIKFSNCVFLSDLNLKKYEMSKEIIFVNCTFFEKLTFKSLESNVVGFVNCIFRKKLDFKFYLKINNLKFYNINFEKDLNIMNANINKVSFIKCNFKLLNILNSKIKEYEFVNNTINEGFINNSIFEQQIIEPFKRNNFLVLRNLKVNKSSNLPLITHVEKVHNININNSSNLEIEVKKNLKKLILNDSIIKNLKINDSCIEQLEFNNITVENTFNCLNCHIERLNRETARIIKHSFEKQNNIIEANKFYALEMQEREKELNKDIKDGKNFFEYIVFLFHSITSNHSQNWLLALFWIIISTFGYTILDNYEFNDNFIYGTWIFVSMVLALGIGFYLKDYINDGFTHTWMMSAIIFIFYLGYGFTLDDFELGCFSSNVNPFSIFNQDGTLGFLDLIYRIIIAYLIYQLIISIRQNTRRK